MELWHCSLGGGGARETSSRQRSIPIITIHLLSSDTGDRPYKCRICGDQFARRSVRSLSFFQPLLISPHQRSPLQTRKQVPCRRQASHNNYPRSQKRPPRSLLRTRDNLKAGLRPVRYQHPPLRWRLPLLYVLSFFLLPPFPRDQRLLTSPFSSAKCNARKTPCTFIKFQRQTAPSGPGHKSSNSVDSSSASGPSSFLGASVPRPDELFLGPPPLTVPSMTSSPAGDLFYPQQQQHHPQFTFPPPQPAWDNQHHHHSRSVSLSSSGGATDSGQDSPDVVAARLRHDELVRAGLLPSAYNTGGAGYYGSDQWQFSSQAPAYSAQQLSRARGA